MRKESKRIIAGVAVAVMLTAILSGCGDAKANNRIGKNDYNVSGVYNIAIPSGNENAATILGFNFNKKQGTYVESITLGGESYTLFEGTYTVDENSSHVECIPSKGETQTFIIAGTYLIADGFFYDGIIPDGKSFDLVCTYENSAGGLETITFSKDGTYLQMGGSVSSVGTYERDGDFIHRTTKEGTALADFIIFEGQISNAFYIKNE